MKKRFLLCLVAINSLFAQATNEKFVIGTLPNEGFFSSFISVVNLLMWADTHKKTPVVHWNERSLFHQAKPYNGSKNPWEYYFEPVSKLSYNAADATNIWEQGAAPDESHPFVSFLSDRNFFHSEYKDKIHDTIKKYVKIKQPIQKKIDAFYEKNMAGKTTIGIHLRGTDSSPKRQVMEGIADEAIKAAAAVAKSFTGPVQYYVGTDDEKLLDYVKANLPGTIIAYGSHRSTDGKPIHTKRAGALVGEEVLIEGVLLSKCDYFVHSHSSVPIAVMLLNPKLKSEFIDPMPHIYKHVYGITK